MASTSIAHCARCTTNTTLSSSRNIQQRFLSSSPSLQVITPESPRYIEVPEALQTPRPPLQPIKGILPVPRQIVDKRREFKATPQWLDQTTPEPSRAIDLSKVAPHLRERTIYRQRMAEMRRNSLRQGVSELYNRTVKTDQRLDAAREKRLLNDLKALHAAPRPDETWTDLSISKTVRDALKLKSTERQETEAERAERKAEVERRERKRAEDRLQSLHSLYLHAKDFITDEAQLDKEIDVVFGSEELPMTWAGLHKSVWTLGPPAATKILANVSRNIGFDGSPDDRVDMRDRMKERVRIIAGKLTGGKIPVPEEPVKVGQQPRHY